MDAQLKQTFSYDPNKDYAEDMYSQTSFTYCPTCGEEQPRQVRSDGSQSSDTSAVPTEVATDFTQPYGPAEDPVHYPADTPMNVGTSEPTNPLEQETLASGIIDSAMTDNDHEEAWHNTQFAPSVHDRALMPMAGEALNIGANDRRWTARSSTGGGTTGRVTRAPRSPGAGRSVADDAGADDGSGDPEA